MHALDWGKTCIVGYSLGGLITTRYVELFPGMVEKVDLIAPAGLMKGLPLLARVLPIPILGDLLLNSFGTGIILSQSSNNHHPSFADSPPVLHFNRFQKVHLENHPGFLRAFGSTVVNVIL